MSKSSKSKKMKVPKITETEYAAYLSALREMAEDGSPTEKAAGILPIKKE